MTDLVESTKKIKTGYSVSYESLSLNSEPLIESSFKALGSFEPVMGQAASLEVFF